MGRCYCNDQVQSVLRRSSTKLRTDTHAARSNRYLQRRGRRSEKLVSLKPGRTWGPMYAPNNTPKGRTVGGARVVGCLGMF